MYKLISDVIIRISDNVTIPIDPENRGYQQFVEDIYRKGTEIVEGADYVGVVSYTDARRAEYPPIEDQLDKIYHDGIDAWKADIKVIKDKYPKTQVGITSIAPIPDWLNTVLFDKQKEEYIRAKTRLEQYELANGLKGVVGTESVWDSNSESRVDQDIIGYVIEPLPIAVEKDGETIRNPLVVQDEQERMAAQEVIDNTPQAVIDSVSS